MFLASVKALYLISLAGLRTKVANGFRVMQQKADQKSATQVLDEPQSWKATSGLTWDAELTEWQKFTEAGKFPRVLDTWLDEQFDDEKREEYRNAWTSAEKSGFLVEIPPWVDNRLTAVLAEGEALLVAYRVIEKGLGFKITEGKTEYNETGLPLGFNETRFHETPRPGTTSIVYWKPTEFEAPSEVDPEAYLLIRIIFDNSNSWFASNSVSAIFGIVKREMTQEEKRLRDLSILNVEAAKRASEASKNFQQAQAEFHKEQSTQFGLHSLNLQNEHAPSLFIDSFGVTFDDTIPYSRIDKNKEVCAQQISVFNQKLWERAQPYFNTTYTYRDVARLGENTAQANVFKIIAGIQLVGGLLVTAADSVRSAFPALMLWSCFPRPSCSNSIFSWDTELKSFAEEKNAVIMPDRTIVGDVLNANDVDGFSKCEYEQVRKFWTRTSIQVVKHHRFMGTPQIYIANACPPWVVPKTALYRHEVIALAQEFGQESPLTGLPWEPNVTIYLQKSCTYSCDGSSSSFVQRDDPIVDLKAFCKTCEDSLLMRDSRCCSRCCNDCQNLTATLSSRMREVLPKDKVLVVKCHECENLKTCAKKDPEAAFYEIQREQTKKVTKENHSSEVKKTHKQGHSTWYQAPAGADSITAGHAQIAKKASVRDLSAIATPEGSANIQDTHAHAAKPHDETLLLNAEIGENASRLEWKHDARIICKVDFEWRSGYVDHKDGDTVYAVLDKMTEPVRCIETKLPDELQQRFSEAYKRTLQTIEADLQREEKVGRECQLGKESDIFKATQIACKTQCPK